MRKTRGFFPIRLGLQAVLVVALAFGGAITGISGGLPSTARRQGGAQDDAARMAALIEADAFLEAAKLADGLLARGGLDVRTEAVCGLAVLAAGRVAAAEAVIGRAFNREPGNPEANLGMGRIARIHNDSATALARFRRGLESAGHYEDACRYLWRTALERGAMADIMAARDLVTARFQREGLPAPGWLTDSLKQIEGCQGSGLYQMDQSPAHVAVPLISLEGTRIRMVSMRINKKGPYFFDIDSAAADFLLISPLLAEELGLELSGSSQAIGVGTGSAPVRFARLDRIDLGGLTFRNVPIRVADIAPFRGLKKGLFGTGLLKRFNVTIDARAGVMDLFALDRPELLAARIDKSAVAAEVPLLVFEATMVTAPWPARRRGSTSWTRRRATNLVDALFFSQHIEPKLDPSRITAAGIRGAQGPMRVRQVNGLTIRLGPLLFDNQQANEFSMSALNAASGRYAAGLLGNPLMWPYRCHLDFKNGRLILERYEGEKARLSRAARPASSAGSGRPCS